MLAPVSLPEFNLPAISWAMCRNPMCVNFGIHFAPQEPMRPNAASYGDSRYRLIKASGRIRCQYCGQSHKPKSNEAIRVIARYYLSLSLPFATCSDPACSNYGVNVFEKYARWGSPYPRYYRKTREETAICRVCESTVTLGERRSVRRNAKTARSVRAIISSVQKGVKKRKTVHYERISSSAYYGQLHRIGARLRDYHAWLHARLLDSGSKVDFSEMAKVYTDVVDWTLRRQGDVHKYSHFKAIVSVLAFKRTRLILAVHPFFLPDEYCPRPEETIFDPETGWPSEEFTRRWECIAHPALNRFGDTLAKTQRGQADVSRWGQGLYIRATYAAIAHFLVIRKMLQRFDRICFYMDNGRELAPSALTALADDIRTRRVDIVSVQRKYKGDGLPKGRQYDIGAMGSERRRKALRRAWNQTEKRVQKAFEEGTGGKKSKRVCRDPAQRAARAFTKVRKSAYEDRSDWAWLRFPAPKKFEKLVRSLWLTRMPGKTFEDAEEPLLYATLHPVDSVIMAMREHARGTRRPDNRARGGRSFKKQYVNPITLFAEVSIYLLGVNYSLVSPDIKTIPAQELGLITRGRARLNMAAIFDNFRLGLTHADKISQWLRR